MTQQKLSPDHAACKTFHISSDGEHFTFIKALHNGSVEEYSSRNSEPGFISVFKDEKNSTRFDPAYVEINHIDKYEKYLDSISSTLADVVRENKEAIKNPTNTHVENDLAKSLKKVTMLDGSIHEYDKNGHIFKVTQPNGTTDSYYEHRGLIGYGLFRQFLDGTQESFILQSNNKYRLEWKKFPDGTKEKYHLGKPGEVLVIQPDKTEMTRFDPKLVNPSIFVLLNEFIHEGMDKIQAMRKKFQTEKANQTVKNKI